MIDFHTFQQIRQLHDQEGLHGEQIAQRLNLHRQTVNKWIKRLRYEKRSSSSQTKRPSKLDAFKGTIVRLLASHPYTAAQLFARLKADGYAGS